MKELELGYQQMLTHAVRNETSVLEQTHRNIELIFVLKGCLNVRVNEDDFRLESKNVLVINSGNPHSWETEGDSLYLVIQINHQMLLHFLGESKVLIICNSSVERTAHHKALEKDLQAYLRAVYEENVQKELTLSRLSYQIVEDLVQHFSITFSQPPSQQHQSNQRKWEMDEYIRIHYASSFSLKDLANHLYLSTAHLSKTFKELFGMTFLKYVNQVRLEHAVQELIDSSSSVTTIAMNNGFPNVSSFIKTFKDSYGTTPNEYRLSKRVDPHMANEKEKKDFSVEVERILEKNRMDEMKVRMDQDSFDLEVDFQHRKPFTRYWRKIVNLSDAHRLISYPLEAQTAQLRKELDFEYGRIWGLFSNEMKVLMTRDSTEINFFNIERVIDSLMDNKIKPYIVIHLEKDTAFLRTPEHDAAYVMEEFYRVFRLFISHLTNRYGITQVDQWYFEITTDSLMGNRRQEEYLTTFDRLHQELNQISPSFHIGGPGIRINYEPEALRQFIRRWYGQHHTPDFLTFHSNPELGPLTDDQEIHKLLDSRYIRNQMAAFKRMLEEEEIGVRDIQLSVWNATPSHRTILNDSCYKGAYILKNVIDCFGLVDGMGYWYALDSISTNFDTPRLLSGSPGLLSQQYLKKPSYYAYYFLNIGKVQDYLGRNDYSLVTTDGYDNYFIVCHNCGTLNYKYFMTNYTLDTPEAYEEMFDEESRKLYTYRIRNVKNGAYKIKIQSVNEQVGNLQKEWMDMNLGSDISKSEIIYLRNVSVPRIQVKKVQVENGILEVQTTVSRNEFQNIRITYQY